MEIVLKYSYSPNWAAQSLRSRKTQTIGLVIPNITNGFFGQIGIAVDTFFRKHAYNTLICFTSSSHENELESLKSLLSKNIDGIILAPVGFAGDYFNKLPQLREQPLVIIDNKCKGIHANYVLHDNEKGARRLVEHLIEHGHKKIACITGLKNETSGVERLSGYREALEKNGLPYDEALVKETDWEIESGFEATIKFFKKSKTKPTAIFYANSQLLLGGYKAFNTLKLSIPSDVAVVSFDPPYVIDALTPRPTTLSRVEEKIGITSAKLLFKLMKGEGGVMSYNEYRIPGELCIGESCGCKKF